MISIPEPWLQDARARGCDLGAVSCLTVSSVGLEETEGYFDIPRRAKREYQTSRDLGLLLA